MEPVHTEKYRDHNIEIFYDECAESPRDWDNLGTMVCFHKSYNLGDEHNYKSEDYSGWQELENQILKDNPNCVILPIYMYDHSGITIRTYPFSCPWDSGQIGYIYCSLEKIRKEYNRKLVTKQLRAKVEEILISEIKTCDQYLIGDVYGYRIKNNSGEEVDSCWGCFGIENAIKEAKETLDYLTDNGKTEINGQLVFQM